MSNDSREDDPVTLQTELERTRVLLREVLETLMDDGYAFRRDGPLSEWLNEDIRRTRIEA